MKAIKEKETVAKAGQEVLTVNELLNIQQAIQMMLESSQSMKGKYVRVFLKNMDQIDTILAPAMKKQNDLTDKYCEKGEDGLPIRDEADKNKLKFKNDDDAQKFDALVSKIWDEEVKISLPKMSIVDFDELEINTSRNNSMYLILKYLVNQN
jgi:hypothetical protein